MCNFTKAVDKKEIQNEFKGYFSQLRKIINSWNLIPGCPNDEFDYLNNKILSQLYKNSDFEKIEGILKSELIVNYGFLIDEIQPEFYANEIIHWWNKRN